MIDEKKVILAILSRILEYPEQTFKEDCERIFSFAGEYLASEEIRKNVLTGIKPLYVMPLKELQELYVETFDQRETTNLYLTAHELGDSKKRGAALIKLQSLICEAGFDYAGKELVDYIPMLLELLAVGPSGEDFTALSSRVACVMQRILNHLPKSNPYFKAVELLILHVFGAPEQEQILSLEQLREEADLAELPYPLMYR
jgi:nitrate reductase delta subunit